MADYIMKSEWEDVDAAAMSLKSGDTLLASKQARKNSTMTEPVGVDENGKLFVRPAGNGGGNGSGGIIEYPPASGIPEEDLSEDVRKKLTEQIVYKFATPTAYEDFFNRYGDDLKRGDIVIILDTDGNGKTVVYQLGKNSTDPLALTAVMEIQPPTGEQVGAPADWNAAEGEPGHILNRTHYSRTEQGTLLPEASLPFLEEVGGFMVTDPISVVTGCQYTVTWNGVPYTCTCAELEDGDTVVQVLGNASALGGDNTGEPFVLVVASAEQAADAGFYAIVLPLDGAASVTLSVSGMKEVVAPLPAKYLPKLRGQQHFVIDLDAEKTSIPFAEAAAMDIAELQAAATVIYEGESYSVSAIKAITEVVLGNAYEMFEISCTGREAGVCFVWTELGVFTNVRKTVLVPSENYQGHVLSSNGTGKVAWLNPSYLHFDTITFLRSQTDHYAQLTVNRDGQIELLDTNNVKFATFSPDGAAGRVAVIWYTTVAPTSNIFVISDLVGPVGATPSPGHMIVSKYNGNAYFVAAVNDAAVTVQNYTVKIAGNDGYTPQKGIDYWTQADQETIVQQVIAALGTPVFGRVDAQNNIILSGNLVDGAYTVKYEDAEGNVTRIGTLSLSTVPEPTYTNQIPLSVNADGTLYNGGAGWKAGTRLNSSGVESTSNAGEIEVTGFIPVKSGDIVYLSGITMNTGTYAAQTYIWLYDSNFTPLPGRYRLFSQYADDWDTHISQGKTAVDSDGNLTKLTIDHNVFYTGANLADLSNAAYLRISCEKIDDNSIITVNEPIV